MTPGAGVSAPGVISRPGVTPIAINVESMWSEITLALYNSVCQYLTLVGLTMQSVGCNVLHLNLIHSSRRWGRSLTNIATLLASKFIARGDVKAIQHRDGSWSPHTDTGKRDGNYLPWNLDEVEKHISGTVTYGHYLLDKADTCKLFAFDIDLNETGFYPDLPGVGSWENSEVTPECIEFNPRASWQDRRHPARPWMKYQFKQLANALMLSINRTAEVPCAAAYSGAKGIHVYGFTKRMPAFEVRLGMQVVLDDIGQFKVKAGKNFFEHANQDPWTGYPNISIETFPKQDSLEGGDGLGNLMRLPLGRNLKSTDPTFFLDMTSGVGEFRPLDTEFALTAGSENPWSRPDE